MKFVLISACLVGENVRYDANVVHVSDSVKKLMNEYELIPICPEVLGGLDVPRQPCEITGKGGGRAVLSGLAKIAGDRGTDFTAEFISGAKKGLETAQKYNVEFAVLKERSPSCGSGRIYSGSFNSEIIEGEGVLTALLRSKGIKVISEEDI